MSAVQIIDYNGTGIWSRAAILDRYARYRQQLRLPKRSLPGTETTQGDRTWVYPVMNNIIASVAEGDPAAVKIALEFVEEDQSFAFGMIIKSRAARALRQRVVLREGQQARLRRRFADMLMRGYLPREYKEYAKLFRKIGLGEHRAAIEAVAQSENPFIRRWAWYLRQNHEGPRPAKYLRPW